MPNATRPARQIVEHVLRTFKASAREEDDRDTAHRIIALLPF